MEKIFVNRAYSEIKIVIETKINYFNVVDTIPIYNIIMYVLNPEFGIKFKKHE